MPLVANACFNTSAVVTRNNASNGFAVADGVRHDFTLVHSLSVVAADTTSWRTLETRPGHYDFTPLARICEGATTAARGVVIDLLNFEWPDYLDVTRNAFGDAFAEFADAAVQFLAAQCPQNITIVPVQQISLLAAAAGDFALLPPYLRSMGGLVQRQLVKAAIRASKLIRITLPRTSLLSVEPILDVCENQPSSEMAIARRQRIRSLEIWDMLTGRRCPELGGSGELLDSICVRFLQRHPWADLSPRASRESSRQQEALQPGSYHGTLIEVHQRYRCPLLVAGYSKEDGGKTHFLDQELTAALHGQVPIVGLNFHSEDKSLESLATALDRERALSATEVASAPESGVWSSPPSPKILIS
jgi:hypothetical protein